MLLVLLPEFIEITSSVCTNIKKSSESKGKFIEASNCCKRLLEAAKFAYANKRKELITSQKLCSKNFWSINSVLNKGESAIPPLFNNPKMFFSASDVVFCNFHVD